MLVLLYVRLSTTTRVLGPRWHVHIGVLHFCDVARHGAATALVIADLCIRVRNVTESKDSGLRVVSSNTCFLVR
jgi:hypothetical protein